MMKILEMSESNKTMKLSVILLIGLFPILSCTQNNEKMENLAIEKPQITKKKSQNKNLSVNVFNRKAEPNENAFTLLVPRDWKIEGGIFRVDPLSQGGASQSIAAKIDFSVKKDKAGTVMIRWLPDVLYFDARFSPAGQMGLFPEGSNYQGMTVLNVLSAKEFINKIAFPYAHPSATNIRIIEVKELKEVAQNYTRRVKQVLPYSTLSYDAALVKVEYSENGYNFEELMVAMIENWGQLGAGMWGNKETFFARVPKGEMKVWTPILSVIQNSVEINLQWLVGEIRGQITRGEIALKTQRQIEKLGREITSHRQKTNSEIHNDMFLTLMDQEEYMNPYTNEIEIGTNQWEYRWVNESGDVIYTETEDYEPNTDPNFNWSGFKRSLIKKRDPN